MPCGKIVKGCSSQSNNNNNNNSNNANSNNASNSSSQLVCCNNGNGNGNSNGLDPLLLFSLLNNFGNPATPDNSALQAQITALSNQQAAQAALIAGSGAVIPFASGLPVVLAVIVNTPPTAPAAGVGSALGFGINASAVTISGSSINLTGAGLLLDVAFNAPRAGTINSLSFTYSNLATIDAVTPPASVNIVAQIYTAPSPTTNTFMPIGTPAVVSIPAVGLAVGGTLSANVTENISVTLGTRILLVITLQGSGLLATSTGYVSAGINIL